MVGRKGRAYRDLDCVEFDVRGVGGVEGGGIFSLTIEGVVGGDTTGGVMIGAATPRPAGGGIGDDGGKGDGNNDFAQSSRESCVLPGKFKTWTENLFFFSAFNPLIFSEFMQAGGGGVGGIEGGVVVFDGRGGFTVGVDADR